MPTLKDILQKTGMQHLTRDFEANNVTDAQLPDLSNDDLKDIGVTSLGDRKAIIKAIADALEQEDAAKKADIAAEKKKKKKLAQQKQSKQQTTLITLLLLFCAWPIGLVIMWVGTDWSKNVKLGVTAGFGLLMFGYMALICALPTPEPRTSSTSSSTSSSQPKSKYETVCRQMCECSFENNWKRSQTIAECTSFCADTIGPSTACSGGALYHGCCDEAGYDR